MIFLLKFTLICAIFNLGLSTATRVEPTISECAAKGGECDENKGRPVCGTDNHTYPTRCHLIRSQCSGHNVSLKHRGTCKDGCLASRSYALSNRAKHEIKFIPKCRADGSYASNQCLDNVGCWCVNSQGKPMPNTTVKHGKPNCAIDGKSNQRRSPPPISMVRPRKNCTPNDRVAFNNNLIKVFHSEYSRFSRALSQITFNDHQIIDWKFKLLDSNKNNVLDKTEYRELKKVAKKIIRPKRCGRAFGKYCDIDRDQRLSREEFASCLSKDERNHVNLITGSQNGIRTSQFVHYEMDGDEEDYSEEDDFLEGKKSDSENRLGLRDKTQLELSQESDGNLRDNDGESDCLSDRSAALDEQRAGTQALYVPECTVDGRYQRVQCYRSTGYCWCVHEDTGKNIPGTSTHNTRPQCDSIALPLRPMKGCPEPKKTDFLKDLKDFLKIQITSSTSIGFNNTKWGTEDERIATLSFVLLDKNKNKVWERKEWKTFRELVTATRNLRKCGKRMPRFCDSNQDRKITLAEWLNCLQAQRNQHEQAKQTAPAIVVKPTIQSKLKGKNPLDSILID